MLVTPFEAGGGISLRDLYRLIDFVLAAEPAGVAALGLAGEATWLSPDERVALSRAILEAVRGVPTIVGCSASTTDECLRFAAAAVESGAAAVMVAPPSQSEWDADLLFEHYIAVDSAIAPVPLMVQDAPDFLGVELGAGFISRLRQVAPNAYLAKPEGLPAAETVAAISEIGGTTVFGGYGGLHAIDVYEAGAVGMIPGCEIPTHHVGVADAYFTGDCERARQRYREILPLLVAEFQGLDHYIVACKLVLMEQGVLSSAYSRAPGRVSQFGEQLLLRHLRAIPGP